MSQQVVGLARKDGRLVAIVSDAVQDQAESPVRFVLRERPAQEAGAVLHPPLGRAVEAWSTLREADWDDPRVLSSALTVIIETVPLGRAGTGPRPLAAHAGLCAPDAWRRLRDALRPREARVLPLLRAVGHGPQVAMLADARDPYVAYHHRAPAEPGLAALPPRFAAFVLPLLRSRPWPAVRRALAVFWALGLQQDDALLALVVRLLALEREHGLAWLGLMAQEEPSRRETLGHLLLETGALAHDPRSLPADMPEVLAAEGDEAYADRLEILLRGLCQGTDLEHLLQGMRIARTFAPNEFFSHAWWSDVRRHSGVRARTREDLLRLLDRFRAEYGADRELAFALTWWKWSAASPARAAILGRPSLLAWPAHTTYHVLKVVRRETPGCTEEERLALAERLLARVPVSHHASAAEALLAVLRKGRLAGERLDAALGLIVRLARPPFPASCEADETAALLVAVAGGRADRLAQLPERSLVKLQHALRADDAWLLREGLESMGGACGRFLLDALAAHPGPLLSTARHLAILSAPRRRALLRRFRVDPVSQRRFGKQPLERMCRAIEARVRPGVPSPIPRKLREHREGGRALSEGSLERHRQAIVRRLVSFRLALLARMALEDLDRGVRTDLSSEGERHALEMLGSVWRNRRLLRRVLRVPPADRGEYLQRHGANRAWLARHPRVDAATWRAGIVQVSELPDGRRLTLGVEHEPTEILRMGTLVGSCLAAGGCWSDSAVAAMADVNKRVIFARDAKGTFVARQLVAIAEDDRLVFFRVYPTGSGGAVEEAFERYDRALAQALNLEIHRGPEVDYQIGRVLARAFHDDGLWDRLGHGEWATAWA